MKIVKFRAFYLISCTFLYACGGSQSELPVIKEVEKPHIVLDKTQSTTSSSEKQRVPAISLAQDLVELTEIVNSYSFSSFIKTSAEDNSVITPYNEMTFFGLIASASQNNSLDQINRNFGFDKPYFMTHATLLLESINSLDQMLALSDTSAVSSFSSSNRLWGEENYSFSAEFLDQSVMYFGTQLLSTDFVTDGKQIAKQIAQQSKISCIDKDAELSDTVLLQNQSSLLGLNWQVPFMLAATTSGEFTLLDRSVIDVPMMKASIDAHYVKNDTEFMIALSTQDPNWTIYLLASNTIETHSDLKTNMSLDKFRALQAQTVLSKVQLTMPNFSINTKSATSLPSASYSVFDKYYADLSALNTDATPDLYVSNLSSNTLLQINEQGISIASEYCANYSVKPLPDNINSVIISSDSGGFGTVIVGQVTNIANLNAPFLFFMQHNPTKTVMYSGQLLNPLN